MPEYVDIPRTYNVAIWDGTNEADVASAMDCDPPEVTASGDVLVLRGLNSGGRIGPVALLVGWGVTKSLHAETGLTLTPLPSSGAGFVDGVRSSLDEFAPYDDVYVTGS